MVDTSGVHDRMTWAADLQRFYPTHGAWATDPRCIEAVVHQVVEMCIGIHNRGVTGLTLGRLPSLQQPDHSDRIFTFPQRIHLMAMLVRHWKFAANQVMQSSFTTQYLARIWTTLWEQPGFQFRWRNSSPEAQRRLPDIEPYKNMPAQPITEEEKVRYMLEAEGSGHQHQQCVVKYQRRLEDMRAQPPDVMKRPLADLRSPAAESANKRPRLEGPAAVEQQPQAAGQENSTEAAGSLPPVEDLHGFDFSGLFNVDQVAQDADVERMREVDALFEGSPVQLANDGNSFVIDPAQGQEGGQQGKSAGERRDE